MTFWPGELGAQVEENYQRVHAEEIVAQIERFIPSRTKRSGPDGLKIPEQSSISVDDCIRNVRRLPVIIGP